MLNAAYSSVKYLLHRSSNNISLLFAAYLLEIFLAVFKFKNHLFLVFEKLVLHIGLLVKINFSSYNLSKFGSKSLTSVIASWFDK